MEYSGKFKMKNINFEKYQSPKFELVLQVRDSLGNPTGKTKSLVTDSAEELDNFFLRNTGSTKKKEDKKTDKESNTK